MIWRSITIKTAVGCVCIYIYLKAKKMANSSEGAAIHVTQNVPFRWISICVATIC